MSNRLLNSVEVSEMLGCHPQTLANWRKDGVGPLATKIGRRWKYRKLDIDMLLGVETNETEGVSNETNEQG
jgi:predicted site-specific integrase-resolvase